MSPDYDLESRCISNFTPFEPVLNLFERVQPVQPPRRLESLFA